LKKEIQFPDKRRKERGASSPDPYPMKPDEVGYFWEEKKRTRVLLAHVGTYFAGRGEGGLLLNRKRKRGVSSTSFLTFGPGEKKRNSFFGEKLIFPEARLHAT